MRRSFISKARIHATDRRYEPLREKALGLIYDTAETTALTAFQDVREIPAGRGSPYYKKDKLNFDKVYEDLLKELLDKLSLQEYRKVVIIIDSRKHKGGPLGKEKFRENILAYLKQRYSNTIFRFDVVPSSSNILIEIADFVSNSFYKKYQGREIKFLERLKNKTIVTKNPLRRPRG